MIDGTLEKAKLIDFGYALRGIKSKNECIKGTAAYLSPEIHCRLPYNLQAADVFALGVTFHSLATGHFACMSGCTQGDRFYGLLCRGKYAEFWGTTAASTPHLSADFKHMIQMMLQLSQHSRPSIEQVKEFPWLNLPCAPKETVVRSMHERLG